MSPISRYPPHVSREAVPYDFQDCHKLAKFALSTPILQSCDDAQAMVTVDTGEVPSYYSQVSLIEHADSTTRYNLALLASAMPLLRIVNVAL